MTRENRKFDEYIDNKLRNLNTGSVSKDFNEIIMKRVNSEYKIFREEAKRDRLAKFIIGSFISLILLFVISLGFMPVSSSTVEETSINFHPAIDTSSNYLEKFFLVIQEFFVNLLNLFGISFSSDKITLIIGLLGIFLIFWLADRFILRNKLRSIQSVK